MNPGIELHVVYGNGPIGTAVVAALLGRGQRIRVVTRSGAPRYLPPTPGGPARARPTSTTVPAWSITTAGRSNFPRSSAASWPARRPMARSSSRWRISTCTAHTAVCR